MDPGEAQRLYGACAFVLPSGRAQGAERCAGMEQPLTLNVGGQKFQVRFYSS